MFGTLTLRMVARPPSVSGVAHQPFDDHAREVRAGFEVTRGIAAQSVGVQRNRDRGLAEEAAFGGGGDRAGIQHVIAEIRAVVDARTPPCRARTETDPRRRGARSRSACLRRSTRPASAWLTRSGNSRVSELLAPLRLRSGATTVRSPRPLSPSRSA